MMLAWCEYRVSGSSNHGHFLKCDVQIKKELPINFINVYEVFLLLKCMSVISGDLYGLNYFSITVIIFPQNIRGYSFWKHCSKAQHITIQVQNSLSCIFTSYCSTALRLALEAVINVQ